MSIDEMSDQKEVNTSQLLVTPSSVATAATANAFRYQQMQIKTAEDFYLNEKLADVHFAFGSNDDSMVRVPAHKHLLAVVSDVFEKMFYGALKEPGDVTIIDTSDAVFKEFLQFFYLHDIKLSVEYIIDILYLGHKYNVKECIIACVEFLTDNITDENVCAVLTPAIFFDHPKLIKLCDAHIKSNTAAVIESNSFLECHREVLARILMMNLFACAEVQIFEACMAWVRAKSGHDVLSKAIVDAHLGDLFNKIPFASMTIHQFCTLAATYNLVFGREFHSISNMIAQQDLNQSEVISVGKFQWQFKWIEVKIGKGVTQWANINPVVKWITLIVLVFFVWHLLGM